jgi:Asp-tRNA(Asn)/Glu-tRNA(Gln) amidotransferase A subunit family amidase
MDTRFLGRSVYTGTPIARSALGTTSPSRFQDPRMLPAACVPAGRDKATGLPIGVMLTAGLFREDLCLDAALAIEQWHRPPTPIDPVV